jgi:hypothetical protein
MIKKKTLCDLDHNGECLICDCWISECAKRRLINEDYRYESKKELIELLAEFLNEDNFTKDELEKILVD